MALPYDFDISKYPPLPKLRGLFVTGTDTGVGKTLIAGAIARCLRQIGRRVEVFKPVATGCRRDRAVGLVSEDAEFLAACADSRRTLAEIAPVRYATAVAPNVAARREHREVDLQAIFDTYSSLAGGSSGQDPNAVIVEGVGGLLCPITDDFWVIHFARMTGLPLVIVARPGLGTINHTLLTLHAARSAGLKVAGVVVNDYLLEPPYDLPTRTGSPVRKHGESGSPVRKHGEIPPPPGGGGFRDVPPPLPPRVESPLREPPLRDDSDIAMFHNPHEIAARGNVEVLALVPHEKENSVRNATIGPDTQFCIAQVNWEKLMESTGA